MFFDTPMNDHNVTFYNPDEEATVSETRRMEDTRLYHHLAVSVGVFSVVHIMYI